MYQKRITAFIDILGFRNIVAQTSKDLELTEKIFKVLNEMTADNVSKNMFFDISPGVPESEREFVEEMRNKLSQKMKQESTLQVTHFSDSIVISVELEQDMNVMSIFEFLGRLMYNLWNNFKILMRGAITTGDLIHKENGPLFGPAMVIAYDLETNLASHPRIIIDEYTSMLIKNSFSYKQMGKLFKDFGDQKTNDKGVTFKIENGLELNLATTIEHLLHSHFAFNQERRKEIVNVLDTAVDELTKLRAETDSEGIKKKYDYLINELSGVKKSPYL